MRPSIDRSGRSEIRCVPSSNRRTAVLEEIAPDERAAELRRMTLAADCADPFAARNAFRHRGATLIFASTACESVDLRILKPITLQTQGEPSQRIVASGPICREEKSVASAASIIIPATSTMRLPVFGINLSNGLQVQATGRRATTARFRCTPWELEDDLAQAWRRLVAFFGER